MSIKKMKLAVRAAELSREMSYRNLCLVGNQDAADVYESAANSHNLLEELSFIAASGKGFK